ncbi:MAG: DUF4150 domain-containing protein [Minicystis sp.]
MSVTVGVNGLAVVHEESGAMSVAFPDVCLAPALPAPFANVASSAELTGGSTQVRCEGRSIALAGARIAGSSGDEAGSGGGIATGETQGSAEFLAYSFDVKIEGRSVVRACDALLHNDRNTGPAPLFSPPFSGKAGEDDE